MIYIVEDDSGIREIESYALKNAVFTVREFENGRDIIKQCEENLPELIILDIMLPEIDGITLLKRLKEHSATKDIPVIMVTAKTTEIDAVKGLDSGADDYITKPFGVIEFVSRVKALKRRSDKDKGHGILSAGKITIDDTKHQVKVNGVKCELTFKEYEILKLFLKNKSTVFTRERLMDIIWGFDYQGESRTVDMHIKTLRAKLLEAKEMIVTVRNVGYKLEE